MPSSFASLTFDQPRARIVSCRQFCKIVHNKCMKRLPLNVQTLYADLAQSISFSTILPASIFKQTVRGKRLSQARR